MPALLEQRYAYYFAVPLAVLVVLGDQFGASQVPIAAFVAIAAGMLWNAGLGAYHAGIEWGGGRVRGMLGHRRERRSGRQPVKQLESFSVVRCDEAAWRFLGLSLAALPSALPSAKLDLAALGSRIPAR